jgi:hypothetical protein
MKTFEILFNDGSRIDWWLADDIETALEEIALETGKDRVVAHYEIIEDYPDLTSERFDMIAANAFDIELEKRYVRECNVLTERPKPEPVPLPLIILVIVWAILMLLPIITVFWFW